ncbi:hypothetical protein ACV07N_14105 [Roseivirga echinicomitans]
MSLKFKSPQKAKSERHCERLRLSFSVGAEISLALAKAYDEAISSAVVQHSDCFTLTLSLRYTIAGSQ